MTLFRRFLSHLQVICFLSLLLLNGSVRANDGLLGELRFMRLGLQDGLSQSSINAFAQDQFGFMWFATMDGLNRFDGYRIRVYKLGGDHPIPDNEVQALVADGKYLWLGFGNFGLGRMNTETGQLDHFRHDGNNPRSLSTNEIKDLVQDKDGRLWIATFGAGLNRLESIENQTFVHYRAGSDNYHLMEDEIQALHIDQDGFLWIGYESMGLSRLDMSRGTFQHFQPDPDVPNRLPGGNVRDIVSDEQGRVWIACYGAGLSVYDPYEGSFQNYHHGPGNPNALGDNWVKSLLLDQTGRIWIGTANAGVAILHLESDTFQHFHHDPTDPSSLSFDDVRALYQDSTGMIWAGTSGGGLSRTNQPHKGDFVHIKHRPGRQDGLSSNMVMSLLWDREDKLWVGTLGGGLDRFDNRMKREKNYRHDPETTTGIPHNWVVAIFQDSLGVVWVGSHGGLSRYNPELDQFTHFQHDPNDPKSLSHNDVYVIAEDHQGKLWVGTQYAGICSFDRNTQKFTRYAFGENAPGALSHYNVKAIYDDGQGRLWVGTKGGLNYLAQPNGTVFNRILCDPKEPNGLPHNHVRSIIGDAQNSGRFLWLGTSGGLTYMDTLSGHFEVYKEKDGLPDNTVYSIMRDKQGNLWLSTNKGLSRFNPATKNFINFDMTDGLQSNEFNQGADTFRDDGMIIFGGVNGLNMFYPDAISKDLHPPQTVITELLVNNKIAKTHGVMNVLDRTIEATSALDLGHRQTDLTFRFAGLHYAAPQKHIYAYRLEGFRDDWVFTDAQNRNASFTNLDPGRYTFRVKSANKDTIWSQDEATIRVLIPRPPWLSMWAILLYVLLAVGLLIMVWRIQEKRFHKERQINEQLRQIDRLKDDFLANTSHELRTPLNGIIGLAESIIDGAAGPVGEQVRTNMQMVANSGKRLANLVNDILDFSKLKSQNLTLRRSAVAVDILTQNVFSLISPLVGKKDLKLINSLSSTLPPVFADEDRLEQIMHNLLGNAVKFTERGYIRVDAETKGKFLVVSVKDTGIGIQKEHQARIFQSFERGHEEGNWTSGGTGLGLALTRQLVQLHGGNLEVSSQPGKGSTFSFTLPLARPGSAPSTESQEIDSPSPVPSVAMEAVPIETISPSTPVKKEADAYAILVVDDEPINRQVLSNHLVPLGYQLGMASSGKEALAALENRNYDLVLLDIMMPGMSGYEVCQKIRETKAGNVLPVIFLSARNQMQDVAKGFETGANDYLAKPISRVELLARISMHLRLLDASRSLAGKIVKRTMELDARNAELVGWDKILGAINAELESGKVLQAIADQALELVVEAQITSFFQKDGNVFRIAAASGYDPALVEGITFEHDEVLRRYIRVESSSDLSEVRILRNPDVFKRLSSLPRPKAIISIPIVLEGNLVGFLILSNMNHVEAFDDVDMRTVNRFREHGLSALAKVNSLDQMRRQNDELLRTQQQMIMQEKMASLGTLTAGVAHEINNPTAFAHGSAQNLEVDLKLFEEHLFEVAGDEDSDIMSDFRDRLDHLKKHVHTIKEGTSRIKGIVMNLQTFARSDETEVRWASVSNGVQSTLDLVKTHFKDKVNFECHIEDPLEMECRPLALNQVFLNLIVNACEAILDALGEHEEKGSLTICARRDGEIGRITFTDSGCGMSEEVASHIFEPFYTTKPVGKGTGLGLSMSYGVVEKHGGRIEVQSQIGKGTTFTVTLPLS